MRKQGFYSSGEFARMAQVTLRTIRYYDKQNVLKPSYVSESGARFYTEEDLARLQQILLLKYLGFSLEEIRGMTVSDTDYHFMLNSLQIQLKLVRERIEQMQLVEHAILDTAAAIGKEHAVDWTQMLELIHLTGMEKSLKNQYQNASNIAARIHLHKLYSKNPQGWFEWVFEQCEIRPGMRILELGCGDGTLWTENLARIPKNVEIVVSDISEGMLRDARRAIIAGEQRLQTEDVRDGRQRVGGRSDDRQSGATLQQTEQQENNGSERFDFRVIDARQIPYEAGEFDLVIANHVLFYCDDIPKACAQVRRVLKTDGRFVCSAYGSRHMEEISRLVQEFDERIVLAAEKLYERFGRENGEILLKTCFENVAWRQYEDALVIPENEPEALISYVLSCHGNQGQYITNQYKEFSAFVRKKMKKGFTITKDAGVFVAE